MQPKWFNYLKILRERIKVSSKEGTPSCRSSLLCVVVEWYMCIANRLFKASSYLSQRIDIIPCKSGLVKVGSLFIFQV